MKCTWQVFSSATNLELAENVCAENLKPLTKPKFIRQVSLSSGVPKSTVNRIKKRHHVKFYKPYMDHGLLEDDLGRRVEFCSNVIENYEFENKWSLRFVFSDKSTCYRTGLVNKHNVKYFKSSNCYRKET